MSASDDFDGEAISRADREFLTKLGDHPLMRNPLYSAPPPPLPNYAALTSAIAIEAAQKASFAAALDWMLINYAFCMSAFMGKGGIISLVDGEMGSLTSLRGFMQPYALVSEGPRGGTKIASVVACCDFTPAHHAVLPARPNDRQGRVAGAETSQPRWIQDTRSGLRISQRRWLVTFP